MSAADFPLISSTEEIIENTTTSNITVSLVFETGMKYRTETIINALEGITGLTKTDYQHADEGVNPFDLTLAAST